MGARQACRSEKTGTASAMARLSTSVAAEHRSQSSAARRVWLSTERGKRRACSARCSGCPATRYETAVWKASSRLTWWVRVRVRMLGLGC